MARGSFSSKAKQGVIRFGNGRNPQGELTVPTDILRGLVRDHLVQVCRWEANADHYHAVPGLGVEALQRHLDGMQQH